MGEPARRSRFSRRETFRDFPLRVRPREAAREVGQVCTNLIVSCHRHRTNTSLLKPLSHPYIQPILAYGHGLLWLNGVATAHTRIPPSLKRAGTLVYPSWKNGDLGYYLWKHNRALITIEKLRIVRSYYSSRQRLSHCGVSRSSKSLRGWRICIPDKRLSPMAISAHLMC